MYEYIGLEYFKKFVITADDMLMNVISYHFAHNYSNIKSINHLFYFKFLYKYIKQFQLNRKILFFEIKNLNRFIYFIKDYNITSYNKEAKDFLNEIILDKYANNRCKDFISEFLSYLEEEQENKWF